MEFAELRPGVFTMPVGAERVNVSLIVGQEKALLVDTGSSPDEGAAIRQAVASATDRPLATIVLTHAHWDHVLGLAAFPGVEIIAHESFPEAVNCRENQAHAQMSGIDLTAVPGPTAPLSLIGLRDLGNLTVEIASFGPAHTAGDLVVALPGQKILIVGDLVEAGGPPQFDETSSLDGWGKALDSLYAMLAETTLIVPGHGRIATPGDVAHMRSGLAGIWDQAQWTQARGVPVDEVYEYDNLEWPWDRATAEAGIRLAYQELS